MKLSLIYFTFLQFAIVLYVRAGEQPVTENDISGNYVFDGPFQKNLQNRFNEVNKPSKLRLYLLADLARAAEMKSFIANCESGAELKITSKNCTCSNYSCQRYYKTIKKPRILDRNCEDVCCGKRSRGKSLESSSNNSSNNDHKLSVRGTKIKEQILETVATTGKNTGIISVTASTSAVAIAPGATFTAIQCGQIIPDDSNNNKPVVPRVVHVLSKGQEPCVGSILSNRAVITASDCVENENSTIIDAIGKDNDTRTFKIKEILTSNNVKNSAILVLSKPFTTDVDLKTSPCIPQDLPKNNFINCYIGLDQNGSAAKVDVMSVTKCSEAISDIASNSSNYICAKAENLIANQKIIPGSPLFCSLNAANTNSFQIVGIYLKNNSDIYIFDNLKQLKQMVTKYLHNLM